MADPVCHSKVEKKSPQRERRDPRVHRCHGWTPEPPVCVFFINAPISNGRAAPDRRGRETMTNV